MSQDYLTDGMDKAGASWFGLFDVRELVKDNQTVTALSERQWRNNTYAHLSLWLGVFPSLMASLVGFQRSDSSLSWISFAFVLVTSGLTSHFTSEARHHMYEAINEVNGVRRTTARHDEASASPAQFAPKVATNLIGLSFRF